MIGINESYFAYYTIGIEIERNYLLFIVLLTYI